MNQRNILLFIFIFSSLIALSQNPDTTDKVLLNKIRTFISENFDILDLKTGKLNTDELIDVVLILKTKNESKPHASWEGYWERPLLILFQQEDNTYKLKLQTDSLVLCEGCGGMVDPYGGMELKDNLIALSFYGGTRQRWTRDLEFTFDPKLDNFILTKDDEGSYDTLDLDSNYPVKHREGDKNIKITIDKFRIGMD
ncbi:MAG: hypothetical protein ACOYO1_07855 [Bacteroidales bacterium]